MPAQRLFKWSPLFFLETIVHLPDVFDQAGIAQRFA